MTIDPSEQAIIDQLRADHAAAKLHDELVDAAAMALHKMTCDCQHAGFHSFDQHAARNMLAAIGPVIERQLSQGSSDD